MPLPPFDVDDLLSEVSDLLNDSFHCDVEVDRADEEFHFLTPEGDEYRLTVEKVEE